MSDQCSRVGPRRARSSDYGGQPYAYHWTARGNLPLIARQGLKPAEKCMQSEERWSATTRERCLGSVFFSFQWDRWFQDGGVNTNMVLLRVPTDEIKCFYEAGVEWLCEDDDDPNVGRLSDCISSEPIPPSMIEVRLGRSVEGEPGPGGEWIGISEMGLEGTVVESNPPINFIEIDPQARYREFNRKYFGGKLPSNLPITLKPLKGRSGSCKFTLAAVAPHTIATLREVNRYRPVTPDMGRVTLTAIDLSNLMRYDEVDFDGILLHEMVHAFIAIMGWPFDNHGREFLEEARHVQKASGIKIPITHDTKGAEVSKAKRTGVALFERGPDKAYYLFDPKELEAFTQKVKSDCTQFDTARVMLVTSGVWARSTVKKKPEKYGTRYWKLSEDIAKDIAGAEIVAEFDGKKVREDRLSRMSLRDRVSENPHMPDSDLNKAIKKPGWENDENIREAVNRVLLRSRRVELHHFLDALRAFRLHALADEIARRRS